ncbi:substrate-binding periplasmic protein [Lacimicrobium alkaliphilum]|uniref:Amino acid ABC transporter substrate-binding protein n=1 Tax=Lacimicrobium alkaliphilum TaxID=1526571 RepID=A0ABQ1R9Z9_9ALTE|nr:transporter substrate-binding domain-containing protein [Lacimicrobium alkaliphilum]GGD59147.1 amino acid ABC transporter substrate-binding protein [Lacimicrobium alkaliphilum]
MRNLFNVLLFWLVLFASTVKAETLVLAADLWCPYNCEPDSDKPGFMVEIARAVFAQKGIDVEYRLMPWSRAVQSTREGDFDAVIGATLNDAPGFVFPAVEQGQMLTSLWVLPEFKWRYQRIASLSDVILGVSAGYSYGADIDGYVADPRNQNYIHVLFGTKPLAQGLKMLKAGRIDVMVEDESVFRYHVDQFPDGIPYVNAGTVDNPTADTKVYVAFSPAKPDSAQWAEMLSKGIADMRASGDLLRILQRYGLRDWRD